ncbi:MAG: branched-chain amino acid aminotransferase [Luteitalea sp.]|nr:branched-chain amino acid aminotransferase [Luteitalea sp.]
MIATVNVDGRICSEREATVSVFDHGLLFGEGVYETLRTYDRTPFRFAQHLARLRASAERIALVVPFADEELLERVSATMAAAPLPGEAYVRILLTRGVGDIVYDPHACPSPTLIIIVKPFVPPSEDTYQNGVKISLVSVVRNHPEAVNPRIKSNNLLNNALAMQEAYKRGAFEALMRNYRGEISECAQSNFFLVRDGKVLTPPLEAGILPGITRGFVFELGRQLRLPVHETTLHYADLPLADEAFLTSTTREIVPIVMIDDLTIGTSRPGPITQRLLWTFREQTRLAGPHSATGSSAYVSTGGQTHIT